MAIPRLALLMLALLCSTSLPPARAAEEKWRSLAEDGLHDPRAPGARLLQEPRDALANLPPDTAGNNVRWIPALREGIIQPREKLRPETEVRRYDKDVLLNLRGGMPAVRFPHKAHTEWLDCKNCHDHLFKEKRGGTKISMFLILQGQQCGVCHGAVAFPLTECARCHSVPRAQAIAEVEAAEAAAASEAAAKEAAAKEAEQRKAQEASKPAAPPGQKKAPAKKQ